MTPVSSAVDLEHKLSLITDLWSPKVVARMNDDEVKLVKMHGEFVWHRHDETDELFLVLRGHLRIQLRDRAVDLRPGQLYVVPRGVEHCPVADEEVDVLLLEPKTTLNTGDVSNERTVTPEWF